jgi:hypothetical protein
MILCPNGHENADGTTYCPTCKVYIDSSAPHVPEPTPLPPLPDAKPLLPTVSLDPARLATAPGVAVDISIRIVNPGPAAEFAVSVAGPASPWASVSPLTLAIEGRGEGVVGLRFEPPTRAEGIVGTVPFRVNVTPLASPADAVSADGTIAVEAAPLQTTIVKAALEPVTSEGRRDADHAIGVWNQTGDPVRVELSSNDDTGFLAFLIEPSGLSIGGGGAASAQLTVRARKRLIFRGKRLRPFHVTVTANGSQLLLDGGMLQRRFIPWWAVPFVVLLGAVLVLAALLIVIIIIIVISANT